MWVKINNLEEEVEEYLVRQQTMDNRSLDRSRVGGYKEHADVICVKSA